MPSKLFPLQPIFTPIFSRVFPHKLKFNSFGPLILQRRLLLQPISATNPAILSMRKFSSRSGQGARAAASKSLIEDEADLSDWVSVLGSNSMKKTRMYSDSDNGEGENGGFRGGERGGKRRREVELSEDSDFTRRRGGGDRGSSNFESSRGGGSRGSGSFEGRRGGGSRGSSDFEGRRGGGSRGSSDFESRRGGGSRGSSDFESRRGGGSRGSSDFESRRGGGSRGSSDFDSRRGGGSRGSSDFESRRGGGSRGSSDFESRRGGGNRGLSNFEGRRGGGSRGSSDFDSPSRGRNSSESFMGRRNNENDSNGGSFRGRGRGRGSGEFRRGGKFGNQVEEMKRNGDGLFSRGDEGRRGSERGPEVRNTNGRGRGGDQGGLRMKQAGKGMGQRGAIVTDDDDEEEEEEDEEEQDKGFKGFKELIDSDEEEDEDEDEEDEDEDEEEEGADRLLENASAVSRSTESSLGHDDSYLSESRFDQCSVSPSSLKGIKDAGYVKMTLVQEATLPLILKGKDVLAKAKTGTGKTVAFLLPAIELVVKSTPVAGDQKRPPIFVLVICPTRELACQAAAEANKLLKYHSSIGVQVVIGGTRLALEQKRMQANPCQILVATPGRLRDHVENTAGFATRLMGVKALVLDEADHLLDMGFRKDIERIIAAVPKQRQTLLFSATIPQEVRQICHIALKKDHEYVNTVQEGSEDTHSQVKQTHLVAPLDKHFPLLYSLLKEHIADDVNYKILVFCTTAMVTRLVAALLEELKLNVREIHSRKPQSYRTRISDEFRKSKGLILVTSDVSARGVDYPDVTLVVQIGVPSDRQQYVHRLGRTGRKGKEGQGILMLAPWEEFFLSTIKDLPISKATEPIIDPDTRKKVENGLSRVEMKNKEAAYQAWLGYYNSTKNVGRDKCKLVELANEFSRTMGLDTPPAISKQVLGKMGLKNIPGLRSK